LKRSWLLKNAERPFVTSNLSNTLVPNQSVKQDYRKTCTWEKGINRETQCRQLESWKEEA
jgi:hypothetical protein